MAAIIKILLNLFDQQDKKRFAVLVLLMLCSGVLALIGLGSVLPFITTLLSPGKSWLTHFFPQQEYQHVLLISVFGMVVGFWMKNILSYFCLRAQTKVLYGMAYRFSRMLFQGYMQAPYIWHLNKKTPDLIRNVINECAILANGVFGQLGNFATELTTSLFILIVLLYINIAFTLMVGGALFIFMLIFMRVTKHKASQYAQDRARAWSAMSKDVMQGLGGLKEVKIYELESHFMSSFNKNTHVAAGSAAFSNVYSQSPRFILEAAAITVVMLSIGTLVLLEHSNKQIVLLLSVFAVAAMQLLPSLNRMMAALTTLKYSLPALEVVAEEIKNTKAFADLEIEGAVAGEKMAFHKEITLQNISFSYPDGKAALKNISLVIQKGQSVAFVGHSGAGKTTLADVLLGVMTHDSGAILVDGVCLDETNLVGWHQHLGYIPQSIYLYDCTIAENVAFGTLVEEISQEQVWQALEMTSMKHFVESLPDGLNTQIGENGVRLSGGQRQRIGIARALFRNPDILIMDEATAALDNQTEREVTDAIQKVVKNRTVITIAHRLSTIKNSDVIYVMDQGQLVSSGAYDVLLEKCEIFQNLVKLEKQK